MDLTLIGSLINADAIQFGITGWIIDRNLLFTEPNDACLDDASGWGLNAAGAFQGVFSTLQLNLSN